MSSPVAQGAAGAFSSCSDQHVLCPSQQIKLPSLSCPMHLPRPVDSCRTVMAASKSESSWEPELKKTWSATAGAPVSSIALSSKGQLAVRTNSSVLLFDPPPSFALKKEIQAAGSAGITATSFSSKGTDLVLGGADGFVKWCQVDTGEEVCVTPFPQAEGNTEQAVQEVACSKAGFVAATSGR